MANVTPTGWLPDFVIKRGLLTPDECRVVIAAGQDVFYPAVRIDPDGTTRVDTGFRACQTAHLLPGNPAYQIVTERLLEAVQELNEAYGFEYYAEPSRMIPTVNLNRYEPGLGHIGWHTDVGGYEGTENCKLSLSILLTDDFDGGEFRLNSGYHLEPLKDAKAGDLVAFPSFMLHQVQPVTRGERITAIVWLRGPRFK